MDQDRRLSAAALEAEYLDPDTERALAVAWQTDGDKAALDRLISAHLRMAIRAAARHRRTDIPFQDLVQEAAIGLLKAAERFDPDRGVRFASYAAWWVQAHVQDFVMRNRSMVRFSPGHGRKALLFSVGRLRRRIESEALSRGEQLDEPAIRQRIAEEAGTTVEDVQAMETWLAGRDFSLDAPTSGREDGLSWVDLLEDPGPQAAEIVERDLDDARRRHWIDQAMAGLTERERMIIRDRKLASEPRTLGDIGVELGLSSERVRQIETTALEKMRKSLVRTKAVALELA